MSVELKNTEDCHADNARLALPDISRAALMNLAGACLREIQRRDWERLDLAQLSDAQAIIDNWE